MSVVLVGGMDRLTTHYVGEAGRLGISLKVFNVSAPAMVERIGNVDAVVVFTNKVSHEARKTALRAARSRGIPVILRHSCGICTFRNCLECLKKQHRGTKNA